MKYPSRKQIVAIQGLTGFRHDFAGFQSNKLGVNCGRAEVGDGRSLVVPAEGPGAARQAPLVPGSRVRLVVLSDADILIHSSFDGPLWYRRCEFMTISDPRQDMTPDRIRAIRERLRLTQEEAGALLGGGPRAFTKYESGSMRPRAAMSNLLRVLEEYSEAVWVLRGDAGPPPRPRASSPFGVAGKDLEGLRPEQLHELLGRLLSVEAQANGIPLDGIHVSSNIAARDGGEDGRISWRDGPERTRFLPSRLCQFQLKAGGIRPALARREVMVRDEVKPMVRSVLEQDGHYIMLCAHAYTRPEIERRERAIRKELREAGLPVSAERASFRDATMMALWVNAHPSVALWVQERVGLTHAGRFTSWSHWKRAE